jgi:hypothetical protein
MKAVETTETIHEANFSRTISFTFYFFTFLPLKVFYA